MNTPPNQRTIPNNAAPNRLRRSHIDSQGVIIPFPATRLFFPDTRPNVNNLVTGLEYLSLNRQSQSSAQREPPQQ